MKTQASPEKLIRSCYAAYERRNRKALEALLSDDFRFTSPIDNRLDRETYLRICWPNSESLEHFEILRLLVDGDQAFVTYEAHAKGNRRFRNTEFFVVRDGKIASVEVYFGWSIPHPAAPGTHIDDA
jgi:ketosteroid isomerase-like protein